MSTLQEILDKIDARLPNTFTDAQKVDFIEEKLRAIWPHIVFISEDTSLKTVIDQEEYDLPEGIRIEHIDSIYISQDTVVTADTIWDEYKYKRPNQEKSGKMFFNAYGGKIGLYPIPDTKDLVIKIRAKLKPATLDPDDTDFEFDDVVDDEFQVIFVYDCLSIISESPPYEDAARARYFADKAESVMSDILEKELRYKIKLGNKPRPNSWWRR